MPGGPARGPGPGPLSASRPEGGGGGGGARKCSIPPSPRLCSFPEVYAQETENGRSACDGIARTPALLCPRRVRAGVRAAASLPRRGRAGARSAFRPPPRPCSLRGRCAAAAGRAVSLLWQRYRGARVRARARPALEWG